MVAVQVYVFVRSTSVWLHAFYSVKVKIKNKINMVENPFASILNELSSKSFKAFPRVSRFNVGEYFS